MSIVNIKVENPSITKFVSYCHKRKYASKQTIIEVGSIPDTLHYIVEGSVSILLESEEDDHEIVLDYLNPGDFFGEMGLFDEEAFRSAWVKSKTPCVIAQLSYAESKRRLSELPDVLFEISRQMALRLKRTSQKVSDLAFLDVTGRVASILLDLLSNQPDAMTHPEGMQIKVTRQEIGKIVGCSREMAGRVLKNLEEKGLISVSGKTIVVFDKPKSFS
ncbi:MAG: cAMP-activated global transcriptional regulator CRP [Gammaproteobacteria bacterium]|nr:cAMP-activated global transcriptional regulator CRP [Gammaproteobacteria bacterium]